MFLYLSQFNVALSHTLRVSQGVCLTLIVCHTQAEKLIGQMAKEVSDLKQELSEAKAAQNGTGAKPAAASPKAARPARTLQLGGSGGGVR